MLKGKARVITHEVGQGLLREMSRCFPEDLKAVVRHDPGGRVPPLSMAAQQDDTSHRTSSDTDSVTHICPHCLEMASSLSQVLMFFCFCNEFILIYPVVTA